MAQSYSNNPIAILRMSRGHCPECGKPADDHTGWGSGSCSLTDNGVADRIYPYERARKVATEKACATCSGTGLLPTFDGIEFCNVCGGTS